MAIVISPGFISTVADNAADLAAGLLTPSRHNLACTIAGLTANALLLSDGTDLTQDGTNLLYTTASGPRLQIGSGSTTSTGFYLGYSATSGYAAIWPTGVTPSSSNVGLLLGASSTDNRLNTASGGNVFLTIAGTVKLKVENTAGAAISLPAGTATTDVNALSATQTWNAAGVAFTSWKFTITDTASAAGSLAMQILGGASGTTSLLKVTKAGQVDAPSYAVGGAAGVSFGPSAVTSITVVNGIVTAIS